MFRLFIAFLLVTFANQSFSQARTSTSASATIITSLVGMTATVDSGSTGFTVTPSPFKTEISFKRGDTFNASSQQNNSNERLQIASFNLIGDAQVYDIALPSADIITTREAGAETMKLSSFTVISSNKYNSAAGAESLAINATLHMDKTPVAGKYITDTPLTIIVSYN